MRSESPERDRMDNEMVCARCGKQKIVLKTWKESVETYSGSSEVTYTQYVCPDEACQKMNDEALEQKQSERYAREQETQKREQARAESRINSLKNSRKKAAK